MYLLLLYFPFINFIILGLFGRFIGTKGSYMITVFNMLNTVIISYYIFYNVMFCGSICYFKIFSWFNIGLLNVSWGLNFDPITSVMLIVVNTVSFLVHLYSIGYMKEDPFSIRFISYLSLFTLFMLILVTADNLLQLFLGWEGVGLVSYLLINFWFTIVEANKSAIKAILMNRIGDIGLGLGICLIYLEYKTLDFSIIFPLINLFKNDYLLFLSSYSSISTLIVIFIMIGAIGKSAQLGLHTWLPDAMAGPTPVSALIHAATMVTAGVFILIRISPILETSYNGLLFISIIGVLTAFFSATIGLFQNDCKKIIAYSTCSQLGYMVFICGLSNYSLSLFHLTNHAFFKALLFLSAGSIIHAMSDEQDIRRFGGLLKILPFSYIMLLIGSLSLMGIPFLTGFYSKDVIIEIAFCSYLLNNSFIYWLSVLSALFTSLYSIRLLFLTFIVRPTGYASLFKIAHDANIFMGIPLLILAINSIFFGYWYKDLFIGLGVDTWLNTIETTSTRNLLILESEFLPFYIKNIPLIFSLLGIFLIIKSNIYPWKYLIFNNNIKYIYILLYRFFSNKWYIDVLYNKIFVKYFKELSFTSFKDIDRGLIELIGPLGLVRLINYLMNKTFIIMQTGLLYNYIFIFILSIFSIIMKISFLNIELDIEVYILIFYSIFFINKNKKTFKSNGINSLFFLFFIFLIIIFFNLTTTLYNKKDSVKDNEDIAASIEKEKLSIYSIDRIGAHNTVDNVYPDDWIHDEEERKKRSDEVKRLNKKTKAKIRRRMHRRPLTWKKFFLVVLLTFLMYASPFFLAYKIAYWYYMGLLLPYSLWAFSWIKWFWPYFCLWGWLFIIKGFFAAFFIPWCRYYKKIYYIKQKNYIKYKLSLIYRFYKRSILKIYRFYNTIKYIIYILWNNYIYRAVYYISTLFLVYLWRPYIRIFLGKIFYFFWYIIITKFNNLIIKLWLLFYRFFIAFLHLPLTKIILLFKFFYLNIKRIITLCYKIYKRIRPFYFLKKIRIERINNIRANIYIILLRFCITFFILPLPISYSFYDIVISHKYHFNHPMALVMVIIVSSLIHFTIGYTLLLLDIFIEIDRNKIFKNKIEPIYKKYIIILNIINFAIVFIFITIIIYYLIQAISWDYNFKPSYYQSLYSERMQSLKRYTADLNSTPCRICYALLLLMKTSFFICFIKFLLFFRILTDQRTLFPTIKKLKKALWKVYFSYYFRRNYYIYRKNMHYFEFLGKAFQNEIALKNDIKDEFQDNKSFSDSYLSYNYFKDWEHLDILEDHLYYDNVQYYTNFELIIINKESNIIFNIYNRRKAYNKLPTYRLSSRYQILAWPRILGFFLGVFFFTILAYSFCNIWVYKIFLINTKLDVNAGFI